MIKNILLIAFIFCFFMMSVHGAIFVFVERSITYLAGFLAFALASFILLVLSEKRSGGDKSYATLFAKILLSTIGGLVVAVLMIFIYSKFGPVIAATSFLGVIFISYIVKGYFSSEEIGPKKVVGSK